MKLRYGSFEGILEWGDILVHSREQHATLQVVLDEVGKARFAEFVAGA